MSYNAQTQEIEMKIKQGNKSAEIKLLDERFYFSVWSEKRGFIASGFRKTEKEAIKAATIVLAAKGN